MATLLGIVKEKLKAKRPISPSCLSKLAKVNDDELRELIKEYYSKNMLQEQE